MLLLTPLTLGRYADELTDTRILVHRRGGRPAQLGDPLHAASWWRCAACSPAVFSVLMSLEPAAAALAGLIVVGEVLSPVQLVAMACVVVASVGATRSGSTIAEPVPD